MLFVAGFCLFGVVATASARGTSASGSSLLRAMNAARTSRGLAPLRADTSLTRAARAHSVDMLRRQYFAHGSFLARILSFHARGRIFGENLAWDTDATATLVVSQWLASPEHRANLLRPGFRRVGIGAVLGTFAGNAGATVVTADFAGS